MTQRNGWRDVLPLVFVALSALFSAWLVWKVTQSLPLMAGFLGAGVLSGAVLFALRSRHHQSAPVTADVNDWSLVRAVSDSDLVALAITDRRGRLVCANDLYCTWFGGAVTPPNLSDDPRTIALLADVGRTAWRDGEAALSGFVAGGREMSGAICRVGRNADHLLWRWTSQEKQNLAALVVAQLNDAPGRILGESGIMATLLTPSGTILASNAAFGLRATGSAESKVDGHDFSALFRVDGHGLIRFAREQDGITATPLRMLELPLDRDADRAPLLMLLFDEDGGAAERGIALEYVETLLTALPFGMAMVDREGRFLFINAAFQRLAGLHGNQLPSYPSDLVISDDKSALADVVRRHAGGRSTSGDLAVRLVASPDESVSISFFGVRGMGEAAVLLSLTEPMGESSFGQQMTQATKMQAVGQLAGGIAHDFNNILTAILGNCDLMLLRHSPGDTDYDDIQQVRSNANRAANLTRQLLAFSRQQTLRPQILNLSDIVADVSHLLQRLIGDAVALDVQHGRGLGAVRADPVQLEQVIVNLAVNARDAMPTGGKLTITTRAVSNAESLSFANQGMPSGDYSLVMVSDTGSGIAPETLPKIFDPFFTTKDLGKGTGLGLATVYGIVKQSGGYIFADSTVGQGTSFSIFLPVYDGPERVEANNVPVSRTARSLHWGSGTILLVEDEEMVRAVAERALVRAGYTVVAASNGEDGLDKFSGLAEVDLIISDVMMPQMDGPTMVQQIRNAKAEVPVLFMSGYAEEQLRDSIGLANVAFLPKPFSVAQLIDAVAVIRNASESG